MKEDFAIPEISEQELLEKFQIEELEKRFEMGWITSVSGSVGTSNGTTTVGVGVGF